MERLSRVSLISNVREKLEQKVMRRLYVGCRGRLLSDAVKKREYFADYSFYGTFHVYRILLATNACEVAVLAVPDKSMVSR